MDTEALQSELRDVYAMLDAQEHEEWQACIATFLTEDGEIGEMPCKIAESLRLAAPGKPMPRFLFDFIVELYESEIENGNADAMNDLGALYYDGYGCAQDYTKAVDCYKAAAKQGHPLARENLGYCYYYGRNIPVDYEKAYQCFVPGALHGMPVSLYKLGDMYQNGLYVEKNEKEAFEIYGRALEVMDEDSAKDAAGPIYLRLGNAFLYGRGTQPDARTALVCFQKAELYLYDMVKDGDRMYAGSLRAAIEGQTKARGKLE